METLNKNWFAFTLVAVVFGLLGYLLGTQNAHSNRMELSGPLMMEGEHEMIWKGKAGEHGEMMFFSDDEDEDVTVDVQTDTTEDGQIRVMVKKIKKSDDD